MSSEITPLVNSYCQYYKQKEQFRNESTELTKSMKTLHDKLKEEMNRADLRIIRSLSNGYDIKLQQKVKKPTVCVKNIRSAMEKHNIDNETIDAIFAECTNGKEEVLQHIRLVQLRKKENDES
tara:strand:+ start:938 stop:1306 length:369 start_codon:yes stop_codon:yes gene_type:complete